MEGTAAHDVKARLPHGFNCPGGRRFIMSVKDPFGSAVLAGYEAIDRYRHLQDQLSHRSLQLLFRTTNQTDQFRPIELPSAPPILGKRHRVINARIVIKRRIPEYRALL